jgi:hypothetical protein
MFKLPSLPSAKADTHELADFAELLAWVRGTTSAREIIAYLGRLEENDDNEGCDDADDTNADELDEVMNEIERRQAACQSGYPFSLEREGTVLRYDSHADNHRADAYRYLLLSTRLNMNTQRMHAEIDGTKLLEELAAHVLRCYVGGGRARSKVFGTAAEGTFSEKIEQLCVDLGEGNGFRTLDTGAVNANDDKLDTVTWIPFSDEKSCKLVIFGQCKTGTNWRDTLTQLVPDSFIRRWIADPLILTPIRAFCISEAADRGRWNGDALYGGLFFDRCRLIDFCQDIEPDLLRRLQTWNTAAVATIRFS